MVRWDEDVELCAYLCNLNLEKQFSEDIRPTAQRRNGTNFNKFQKILRANKYMNYFIMSYRRMSKKLLKNVSS